MAVSLQQRGHEISLSARVEMGELTKQCLGGDEPAQCKPAECDDQYGQEGALASDIPQETPQVKKRLLTIFAPLLGTTSWIGQICDDSDRAAAYMLMSCMFLAGSIERPRVDDIEVV